MRTQLLLLYPIGFAALLLVQWQLTARAESLPQKARPPLPPPPPVTSPPAAEAPARTYTSTLHVEDLVTDGETLWVATRGGVEEYDLATLVRRRVLTTADGLDSNAVHKLELIEGQGFTPGSRGGERLVARTARQRCLLDGSRFVCTVAAPLPPARPAVAPRFQQARVTARATVGEREVIGTAGLGVWLRGADGAERRLTPAEQVCSNHVVAMVEWKERVWFGSFDDGLCSFDGQRFVTPPTPFRMVNDLVVTPRGLHVATSDGLYRSGDGIRFELVPLPGVAQGPVNGLAFDGRSLWATTPCALVELKQRRGGHTRTFWRPAGTRALQSVSIAAGPSPVVWLASEDRGAIRYQDGRFEAFDRAAGLPSSWALDVAATPDGGAYVATLRHGLLRIDPSGQSRTVEGLPDRWLLHASLDPRDGALWVGTQGGAARVLTDGNVEILRGLPEPSVHAVLRAADRLWVATEGGLLSAPTRL